MGIKEISPERMPEFTMERSFSSRQIMSPPANMIHFDSMSSHHSSAQSTASIFSPNINSSPYEYELFDSARRENILLQQYQGQSLPFKSFTPI